MKERQKIHNVSIKLHDFGYGLFLFRINIFAIYSTLHVAGGGCVYEAKGCERGSNVSPSVCLGLEFSFLQVHNCLKFTVFDCIDEHPVFQIVVNLPWDLETLYKVPYKVY